MLRQEAEGHVISSKAHPREVRLSSLPARERLGLTLSDTTPVDEDLFLPLLGSLPPGRRRIRQLTQQLQLPHSGTVALAEKQVEGQDNLTKLNSRLGRLAQHLVLSMQASVEERIAVEDFKRVGRMPHLNRSNEHEYVTAWGNPVPESKNVPVFNIVFGATQRKDGTIDAKAKRLVFGFQNAVKYTIDKYYRKWTPRVVIDIADGGFTRVGYVFNHETIFDYYMSYEVLEDEIATQLPEEVRDQIIQPYLDSQTLPGHNDVPKYKSPPFMVINIPTTSNKAPLLELNTSKGRVRADDVTFKNSSEDDGVRFEYDSGDNEFVRRVDPLGRQVPKDHSHEQVVETKAVSADNLIEVVKAILRFMPREKPAVLQLARAEAI